MYSLDCLYYKKEFTSINELINDILLTGMDPNYEITFNKVSIGEVAADYLVG